ncbi:CAPN15 [Acanthosepion pharaonis]|uniref:CAPN15 n=1 Tax=Acanthosepion pharaonis TaxID=158019 RepID=A0A812BDC8_ACAPH|nr:CAPN15 [Sepia pharaonis]
MRESFGVFSWVTAAVAVSRPSAAVVGAVLLVCCRKVWFARRRSFFGSQEGVRLLCHKKLFPPTPEEPTSESSALDEPMRNELSETPEEITTEEALETIPLRRSTRQKRPALHCHLCDLEIREECNEHARKRPRTQPLRSVVRRQQLWVPFCSFAVVKFGSQEGVRFFRSQEGVRLLCHKKLFFPPFSLTDII